MVYKFRAECLTDVRLFEMQNKSNIKNVEIYSVGGFNFPDVEVSFESELSLNQLIDQIKKLEDSHVMYQTIQPSNRYTGNRNYEL